MSGIKISMEIKGQHTVIAKDDQELALKVAKIKEGLQPNERIVVAKMIVAKVITIKTKTS